MKYYHITYRTRNDRRCILYDEEKAVKASTATVISSENKLNRMLMIAFITLRVCVVDFYEPCHALHDFICRNTRGIQSMNLRFSSGRRFFS